MFYVQSYKPTKQKLQELFKVQGSMFYGVSGFPRGAATTFPKTRKFRTSRNDNLFQINVERRTLNFELLF
jgi:hypothetical protein